ncbi:hypothetical protein OF829_02655 [Sphingomonas sp. LB-2]|uniref:hypothetical protein n=1 Tax=Sphingomonas caeni TaxID=2984949 RepID=UPI0022326851|nr:hypothetical protein [Sphingomonas caeni]MCW3846122.1 hypothetical protein [Sphingomonas caeni]
MADGVFMTATAAVNWFDKNGGLHIRVYGSDGETISERCADAGGSGWTTGTFSTGGSHVSATVWTVNGNPSIRVYCTGDNGTTEWCNDGAAWYQGTYTPY